MKDLLQNVKVERLENVKAVIDYLSSNYRAIEKNDKIKDLDTFNGAIKDAVKKLKNINFAITYQIGNGAKTKTFKRAIAEDLKINNESALNYHIIIKSLNEKDMLISLLEDMLSLIGALSKYNCVVNQGKQLNVNFKNIASCFSINTSNVSNNPKKPDYRIIEKDAPKIALNVSALKLEFKVPAKKDKTKKPSKNEKVIALLEKSKDLSKQAIINELKKIFNIA